MANIASDDLVGKNQILTKFLDDVIQHPISDYANSIASDSTGSSSDTLPSSSEVWRDNFPKSKRNYIIGQIVKSVIPEPDAEALKDKRIKDLISHARLVEKKFFDMAHDREEYYHLVAEKICYFKKEIEQRKKMQKQKKAEQLNKEDNDLEEESSNSFGFSSLSI